MSIMSIRRRIIVLLPIFPLFDFFLFSSFPIVTIFSYIIMILVFSKLNFRCNALLTMFIGIAIVSLTINGIFKGFSIDQIKYVASLLAFTITGSFVGKNLDDYIDSIIKFIYLYFGVNTLIYVYRLIVYSFDFNRVRSGISIFGGNSAHFAFLMVLFLLKKYEEKRTQYYIVLLITFLNSIMFVSKGAILVTLVWIAFDFINQRKTRIINLKVISVLFAFIIGFRLFLYERLADFIAYITERFVIWDNLYKSTGGLMGTRGEIFNFSVDYIKTHLSILIFGNGPTFYRMINPWGYSNTHNLLLDVLFDLGIVGLLVFLLICTKTIFKCRDKFYYLLCIAYATFEGVALFFIDAGSSIIAGFTMFFIIVCYIYTNNMRISEGGIKCQRNQLY